MGNLNTFGVYGEVLSHGIAKPPVSVGKSYYLLTKKGSLIQIKRESDNFVFYEHRVVRGEFSPVSSGIVRNTAWRKLLEGVILNDK